MGKDESAPRSGQNPETVIAQEIFTRDRGAQREIPLDDFLRHIKDETLATVQNERRER